MTGVVAIFLMVLLFRMITRRQRRVVQPAVQVIVIQQPAPPATTPTLSIDDEWARLNAENGSR